MLLALGSVPPRVGETCFNACSSDADCSTDCGVCWANVCDPCHAAPQCGTCPVGCSCSFGFCVKAAAPTPAPPPPGPTPPPKPATLTWVGKSFTNSWTDASNWDPPKVPTLQDDCIVGANFSVSANAFGSSIPEAKSIVVKDKASVSIEDGSMTVGGKVVIQDDAVFAISKGFNSVLTAGAVDVQSSNGFLWMAGKIAADVTVNTILTAGNGTFDAKSGFVHTGKMVNNGKVIVRDASIAFGEVQNNAAISISTGKQVGRGDWAGTTFGSCTNVGTVTVNAGWVYLGADTAAASAKGRILITGNGGLTGSGYVNVEADAGCSSCSLGCQIGAYYPSFAHNVTVASGGTVQVGGTVVDINGPAAAKLASPGLHTSAVVGGTWKVGSIDWFNEGLTNKGSIVADSISISGLVYTFSGGAVTTGTLKIDQAVWPFGNAQGTLGAVSLGANAGLSISGGKVSWDTLEFTGALIVKCQSGDCPPSCSTSPCPGAFSPAGPGEYTIGTQSA